MNTKIGVTPQHRFVSDENGNVIVDFIGKFEKLEEDFGKVCEKIGVKAELSKSNKSNHGHYQNYYNDETKNKIGKIYEKDIAMFGYTF